MKKSVTDKRIGCNTGGKGSIMMILSLTDKRYKNGEKIYLCKCSCGKEKEVKTSDLKWRKSCGCLKGRPKKRKE